MWSAARAVWSASRFSSASRAANSASALSASDFPWLCAVPRRACARRPPPFWRRPSLFGLTGLCVVFRVLCVFGLLGVSNLFGLVGLGCVIRFLASSAFFASSAFLASAVFSGLFGLGRRHPLLMASSVLRVVGLLGVLNLLGFGRLLGLLGLGCSLGLLGLFRLLGLLDLQGLLGDADLSSARFGRIGTAGLPRGGGPPRSWAPRLGLDFSAPGVVDGTLGPGRGSLTSSFLTSAWACLGATLVGVGLGVSGAARSASLRTSIWNFSLDCVSQSLPCRSGRSFPQPCCWAGFFSAGAVAFLWGASPASWRAPAPALGAASNAGTRGPHARSALPPAPRAAGARKSAKRSEWRPGRGSSALPQRITDAVSGLRISQGTRHGQYGRRSRTKTSAPSADALPPHLPRRLAPKRQSFPAIVPECYEGPLITRVKLNQIRLRGKLLLRGMLTSRRRCWMAFHAPIWPRPGPYDLGTCGPI